MSASKDSQSDPGTPPDGGGVLSNLPRTRPQRSSPRRAAAREATAVAATSTRTPTRSSARPAKRPKPSNGSRPRSATGRGRDRFVKEEAVPRQGFECEDERASGPVQPPGGAELIASAAEIVSEVAKAGFSTGERLFRDVLARLPIS